MYSSTGGAWNGYGPPVVWSAFPRTENDARPLWKFCLVLSGSYVRNVPHPVDVDDSPCSYVAWSSHPEWVDHGWCGSCDAPGSLSIIKMSWTRWCWVSSSVNNSGQPADACWWTPAKVKLSTPGQAARSHCGISYRSWLFYCFIFLAYEHGRRNHI